MHGFLVDPGPSTELVTIADLKAYAQIDTALDDAILTDNIAAARQWAEHETGKLIGTRTLTYYLSAWPVENRCVEIPVGPFVSTTTFEYVSTAVVTTDYSASMLTVSNTDRGWWYRLPTINDWPEVQPHNPKAVAITYVAGFATIPELAKNAILEYARGLYDDYSPDIEKLKLWVHSIARIR
jgi:uncharacterized phiE125 gp8 family phage protein